MWNIDGPLMMYMDKRKALRILRLRILCVAPFCIGMFALMSIPPPDDAVLNFLRWTLLLETPVLYFLVSKSFAKQAKPVLSLSSMGITVNVLGCRVGYLPWDEIQDIYPFRFGERMIGITLKDPKKVYARLGLKHSLFPRMNALVAPLYKPFGIRIAPIIFPVAYLPVSADELLEQIRAYRPLYA